MRIQHASIILLCLMLYCCGNPGEAIEQKDFFKQTYQEPIRTIRKFINLLRPIEIVKELNP